MTIPEQFSDASMCHGHTYKIGKIKYFGIKSLIHCGGSDKWTNAFQVSCSEIYSLHTGERNNIQVQPLLSRYLHIFCEYQY